MWRYSSVSGRFIFVDSWAAFSLFPLLFHLSMATLYFVIATFFVFFILERMGFPPRIAFNYGIARLGQFLASLSDVERRAYGPWRIRRAILRQKYN